MKNFMILTESINFIELNICEPITRQDIAKHCHVSLSTLEKLYRYALRVSIKNYISRRRITQAAEDIKKFSVNITDAAMKYQFNSVEVFSRAFKRVWTVNPSEFIRDKRRFTGIFPKINFEYNESEGLEMARKKVDISEAYDYIKSMAGSLVLCFDLRHLSAINDISVKAGDLAIFEAIARIEAAAGDDMIVIRVGGDEFALFTGLYDYDAAEKLSAKVLAKNGEPVLYGDKEISVSLWCGIAKVPAQLRYSEFFTDMHQVINESKK